MKLKQIYDFVIEKGMEADPRGKGKVKKELDKLNRRFEELKEEEKKEFDKEKLTNPYSDTRMLYGNPDAEIKNILLGIDMEVGEILLADRLNQKKRGSVDLVISHHPEGKALAGFYDVMRMQADILSKFGVPINVAEGLLEPRIKEVQRKVMPVNHARAVDAARLLDIPFMCVHTPADNHVTTFLQKLLDRKKPDTVEDVLKILKQVPEYKESISRNAGPAVVVGSKERKAGKLFVDMTGGTEGARNIFEKLATAGIGTLVCMHLDEERIKKAEKEHINIIIAGHIASDNLGLNFLCDKLEKKGKFNFIACSGFRRIKHG